MSGRSISEAVEKAEIPKPTAETLRAEYTRLAALDCDEYELAREAEGKRLGIRVAHLDREVEKLRTGEPDGKQGRPLDLQSPPPWPQPVDGARLLNGLVDAIRRYVSLPESSAAAVVLWAIHSHLLDAAANSPRLFFTSPLPRCGKTTALTVIQRLVARPLAVTNVSPAVLFRTVDLARPTLLIDEADSFARNNEELRGIINSGHTRSGCVIRAVGDDHEPRMFSTWSAMAIAGIGSLPATIEDRSIIIRMVRKLPQDRFQRLRSDRPCELDDLAQMAARWSADNLEALKESDPEVPDGLGDRAADNWRPLIAIADRAGADWSEKVRTAALELSGAESTEETSAGALLLADIQAIFASEGTDKIASAALCARLAEMEGRPWPEWKNGKPITVRQLARLLAPFGVAPNTIRIGDETPKGYRLEQFAEAFARYLVPESATSPQVSEKRKYSEFSKRNKCAPVAVEKEPETPATDGLWRRGGSKPSDMTAAPDDDIERPAIQAVDGEQCGPWKGDRG